MKIKVGSTNETKVQAVAETVKQYPLLKEAKVTGVDVTIEEFGHPKSLEEIVEGACDRAKQAFVDCDYSFGIEGGLMPVPRTKTGFMEVAVCAIYDGDHVHLGLSPAHEWPKKVIEGILEKGLDGSQAFKYAGMTTEEKLGAQQGGIALLTNGRMNRKELNKIAVTMALMHLEFPEHYN